MGGRQTLLEDRFNGPQRSSSSTASVIGSYLAISDAALQAKLRRQTAADTNAYDQLLGSHHRCLLFASSSNRQLKLSYHLGKVSRLEQELNSLTSSEDFAKPKASSTLPSDRVRPLHSIRPESPRTAHAFNDPGDPGTTACVSTAPPRRRHSISKPRNAELASPLSPPQLTRQDSISSQLGEACLPNESVNQREEDDDDDDDELQQFHLEDLTNVVKVEDKTQFKSAPIGEDQSPYEDYLNRLAHNADAVYDRPSGVSLFRAFGIAVRFGLRIRNNLIHKRLSSKLQHVNSLLCSTFPMFFGVLDAWACMCTCSHMHCCCCCVIDDVAASRVR